MDFVGAMRPMGPMRPKLPKARSGRKIQSALAPFQNSDTLRMLEKYGIRVGYTHIKDVDGKILQ
jgi:hypothetical protein